MWFITKSYFNKLIENGIEIFSFDKGFLHSKLILVDNYLANVGSINIDYRSFYTNFEAALLLYGSQSVEEIKSTFEYLEENSRKVSRKKVNLFYRILFIFVKFLTPLF